MGEVREQYHCSLSRSIRTPPSSPPQPTTLARPPFSRRDPDHHHRRLSSREEPQRPCPPGATCPIPHPLPLPTRPIYLEFALPLPPSLSRRSISKTLNFLWFFGLMISLLRFVAFCGDPGGVFPILALLVFWGVLCCGFDVGDAILVVFMLLWWFLCESWDLCCLGGDLRFMSWCVDVYLLFGEVKSCVWVWLAVFRVVSEFWAFWFGGSDDAMLCNAINFIADLYVKIGTFILVLVICKLGDLGFSKQHGSFVFVTVCISWIWSLCVRFRSLWSSVQCKALI